MWKSVDKAGRAPSRAQGRGDPVTTPFLRPQKSPGFGGHPLRGLCSQHLGQRQAGMTFIQQRKRTQLATGAGRLALVPGVRVSPFGSRCSRTPPPDLRVSPVHAPACHSFPLSQPRPGMQLNPYPLAGCFQALRLEPWATPLGSTTRGQGAWGSHKQLPRNPRRDENTGPHETCPHVSTEAGLTPATEHQRP